MLVIKKKTIDPIMYLYGAVAVVTFAATISVMAQLFPAPSADQSITYKPTQVAQRSDKKQAAPASSRESDSSLTASGEQASGPAPQQMYTAPASTQPQPSTAPTPANNPPAPSPTPASTGLQSAPAPTDSTTTSNDPQPSDQDPSLLGGVLGGVAGVVDAVL